jgi:hypothetical protein
LLTATPNILPSSAIMKSSAWVYFLACTTWGWCSLTSTSVFNWALWARSDLLCIRRLRVGGAASSPPAYPSSTPYPYPHHRHPWGCWDCCMPLSSLAAFNILGPAKSPSSSLSPSMMQWPQKIIKTRVAYIETLVRWVRWPLGLRDTEEGPPKEGQCRRSSRGQSW